MCVYVCVRVFACVCFRTGGSGTARTVCIIKGAVCILQSHYRRCLPFAMSYKAPEYKRVGEGEWKKGGKRATWATKESLIITPVKTKKNLMVVAFQKQ